MDDRRPAARTVLAAHGSGPGSEANALVRRLAESLRGRRLFDEVAVAFHQGEPGFDTVLDELAADEITVVPLFTSAGYYSDVVLPEALAATAGTPKFGSGKHRRSERTRVSRRWWPAGLPSCCANPRSRATRSRFSSWATALDGMPTAGRRRYSSPGR